jgi:hypothetical protein
MKTYGRMEVLLHHSWPLHSMGMSGQFRASTSLTSEKESPIPIVQEDGWALEPVWSLWRREKYLAFAGNWTPVVQLVARRYTDWAIPDPDYNSENRK